MNIAFKKKILEFYQDKENYSRILRFCEYLIGDLQKAEDVTQETFLRLILKAEKADSQISFPEDARDFRNYVMTAAKNIHLGSLRTSKGLTSGKTRDISGIENEFLQEKDYNSMQKLDKLHELILQSKKLFTESQLELWNCMYHCMPIEQIVNVLGKDKSTVYSLRNKLRTKIRTHFSLEMIST